MPSTYLSLYYHIVFSTKDRQSLIASDWRHELHAYLGGTINGLRAQSLGVGGTGDHVHVLVQLRATPSLADFMRELKKASSSWARERTNGFSWQEGYAALTVSASAVPKVRLYIENQEAHHQHLSFRDEVLELLRKSGVAVDERYFD